MQDLEQVKAVCQRIIADYREHPITTAYLHGSYVHGTAGAGSDVDLAITTSDKNEMSLTNIPRGKFIIGFRVMSENLLEEDLQHDSYSGRFYKKLLFPNVPLIGSKKIESWKRRAIKRIILSTLQCSAFRIKNKQDLFRELVRFDLNKFPYLAITWGRLLAAKSDKLRETKSAIFRQFDELIAEKKVHKVKGEYCTKKPPSLFESKQNLLISTLNYFGFNIARNQSKEPTVERLRKGMHKARDLNAREEKALKVLLSKGESR